MADNEFLTATEAAELAGIANSTWSAYVARGQAPSPDRHAGRTPLWSSRVVELWLRKRAGKSGRPYGDEHWQRGSNTSNLHTEWGQSVTVNGEHRIYLAGKIAKNDWRHEVVMDLHAESDSRATTRPLHKDAIARGVHTPGLTSSAASTAAHTDRKHMVVVTTAREAVRRHNRLWTFASRQSRNPPRYLPGLMIRPLMEL